MLSSITPNLSLNKGQTVNKSKVETQPQTSFSGLAKFVQSTPEKVKPFLSTQDFLKIASCFNSKTAGTIPQEFLKLYPENPRRVFDFFDQFSQFAKESEFPIQQSQFFKVKLSSGKNLDMKYLDFGSYGTCYKIKFENGKQYVFKTFFDNYNEMDLGERDIHGAVAEVRTGLNLAGKEYKDLAKWHIGSVKDDHSWQIMDFLDDETSVAKRGGVKLHDVRPDLKLGDGPIPGDIKHNVIGGVRYDLGGIDDLKSVHQKQTPDNKLKTFFALCDKGDLYNDYLNDPNFKQKEELCFVLKWMNGPELVEAFYKTLNHTDAQVRSNIAKQVEFLPQKLRKDAFYAVLNHADENVKNGLGSQVKFLAIEDKKDAFYSVLNHSNPRVKNGLANSIRWLAQPEQKELLDDLYKSSFPTFRLEF